MAALNILPGTGWSPIAPQDEALYEFYLALSVEPFSYEHNWVFITQEARVGGFKYEDGDTLLTAVVKAPASPFIFILPPYGNTRSFGDRIISPTAELSRASNRRVVLRKLSAELRDQVLSTGKFTVLCESSFTHPRDAREDQFPQVVLDVRAILAMEGSYYRRMRNDLRAFERQHRPEVIDPDQTTRAEVIQFIYDWCRDYNRDHAPDVGSSEIVDPTSHTILAERFIPAIDNLKYFAKLMRVGGRLVAFTLVGRTGPNCAAQYTNLSLLRTRGCSEFILRESLRPLLRAGLSYLNLGGAETEGQFLFKKKFHAHLIKESFEVEYTP